MRFLDELNTKRKKWKHVIVFDSHQEAKETGFRVLYYDEHCRGTIYGKAKDASNLIWTPALVFDADDQP